MGVYEKVKRILDDGKKDGANTKGIRVKGRTG
jgi:hypothetical protein